MWKPSGEVDLIDLGKNYFVLRMEDEEASLQAVEYRAMGCYGSLSGVDKVEPRVHTMTRYLVRQQ